MGRKPWATPEQAAFLQAHLPRLDEEKRNHGLTVFYSRVLAKFAERWEPPLVPSDDEGDSSSPQLKKKAYDRRERVSLVFFVPEPLLTALGQQITEWFKKHRKQSKPPAVALQPKYTFDLTGKSARKPPPLQPYQAYSVIHSWPDQSPLHNEVQALWARRDEQEVVDMLLPFMTEGCQGSPMLFHNAVMKWKCSLLDQDQQDELEAWIEDDAKERYDAIRYPWGAQSMHAQGMTAENQCVQECVLISIP